jgi:hypothetical protein
MDLERVFRVEYNDSANSVVQSKKKGGRLVETPPGTEGGQCL